MGNEFSWRQSIGIQVVSNKKINYNPKKFENILTRSITSCVEYCLEKNNGEICTTLSGGLDSSYCLALVRKVVGTNGIIHTFSTGGSAQHPDILFARKISDLFGSIHHELIPSEAEKENAGKELYSYWENEQFMPGDLAVFLTYKNIAQHGFKSVICHDGIDELLGGYWDHRKFSDERKIEKIFQEYWSRLEKEHLLPLEKKALKFGIEIILPYMKKEVVEYISKIPVNKRTSFKISKIPLRIIAEKYLPSEVIKRKKYGFCSALDM